MTGVVSSLIFPHAAAPLADGLSYQALTILKAILTTVVLGVALVQGLEQALLYRWIRVRKLNRRLMVRLHRAGGGIALLLTLSVLVVCLYSWLGEGYALSSVRVVAHAALGCLATVILLTKLVIANRFRKYLRYALPLGLSSGALLLGVWLLTALPKFLGLI
jgi:hypothetical protein